MSDDYEHEPAKLRIEIKELKRLLGLLYKRYYGLVWNHPTQLLDREDLRKIKEVIDGEE